MSLFEDDDLKKKIVCGIDEVGRGPLAGPVVSAAVVLPEGFFHSHIKDSKKLSSQKIKDLSQLIKKVALAYSIGVKDNNFIDRYDILTATLRSMEEAVRSLSIKPDIILIDGNQKNPYIKDISQKCIVKGDSKVISISAAAIIAKDYRDRIMEEYGKKFPQYGFEIHKGYGTKGHLLAIEKYGPCEIHRKSFLRSYFLQRETLL